MATRKAMPATPTPAEIEEAQAIAPLLADCAMSWEPTVRLLGNVTAREVALVARALVAVVKERDDLRAPAPRDNIGWRRKLLTWHWHEVSFARYPGWDLEGPRPDLQPGERDRRNPPFVKLTHVHGKGRSSSELAIAWDDIAVGRFYTRDWTKSGIPFVRDGETYWSGWWFEYAADRDRFMAWAGVSDANE